MRRGFQRGALGSGLIVTMMVLTTLSACVLCALSFTSSVSRHVERSNSLREAVAIGDGALDYCFAHWREISRIPKPNVHLPTSSFTAIALPSSALFPDVPSFTASAGPNPATGKPFTVANYKVVATDQFYRPLASASDPPVAQHGMSLGTANYNYLATVDVTLPAMGGNPINVNLRRIFTKAITSPWIYAIFYVDDLEIHPGADQDVTGWVHTNAKLFTAHQSLSLLNKVSYGDDWSRNFKPGDSRYGNETPTSPHWPADLTPFRDQGQQPFGLDATRIFNTTDTSANNDSYRELIERPTSGTADPVDTARYYNQAGIKITVNAAGTPTYRRLDGTVISASSTGDDLKLYNVFAPAVTVGATITDNRESSTVRLVDLDVGIINTKLRAAGAPAFNGIVYVSDTTGSATTKRAARLKNGAIIPPGGLTVATDNGLFIQGDYNTGRTSVSEPPSNSLVSPDPTRPTVSGYTRQPCAVLADAVMILSNSWVDSNSSASLSSRPATPTTVNTAIVSGIVPTTGTAAIPGDYSGGAENFPRFLESWSSKAFTYYGSMVQLYTSRQFNSPWKNTGTGPNVYNAPNRRWYFDTNFFATPPPGTLQIVSYQKGRWFRE
ncbi:MAG TPA: hypothetical protein VGO90_14105 [Chthoniobacteraceae bacterium]|jgi:hypothetical protein|nr:hypothetical protein [Chthoniobacteraceae bacterium]